MKKNTGMFDRIARILVAIVIAILFFTHVISGVLGIVLMIFAGVFFVTALVGVCPIYSLIKVSTAKKE
jgi:hypothetical protein